MTEAPEQARPVSVEPYGRTLVDLLAPKEGQESAAKHITKTRLREVMRGNVKATRFRNLNEDRAGEFITGFEAAEQDLELEVHDPTHDGKVIGLVVFQKKDNGIQAVVR